MAGPTQALAGAGMGGTLVGGLIQGLGANLQGQSQAAASTYKAGVAKLNAQINQQNATWATEAGDTQAMEAGLKAKQQIGQTKVQQAASGLDVNTGTGEAVREAQSTASDFDQNVIRFDAAKTTYGYESKAAMDTGEANLDLAAASTEKEAGELGMLGSFINAGSSVASKWTQASKLGMFS